MSIMFQYRVLSKLLMVLCGLFLMLIHLDVAARERIALVIGNANYQNGWAALPNAGNDAEDMARVLKQLRFRVLYGQNLTIAKMEEELRNFVNNLAPNDVGLFYYAGHGVEIEGLNYLIPISIGSSLDENSIKRQSLSIQDYIDDMEKKRASGLNIIILDACRNNPFQTSRSKRGGLSPISIKNNSRGMGSIVNHTNNIASGIIIGFATAPNHTASENPEGRNGLFTEYLLQAINTPGLTLEDIFKQTATQVYKASNREQLPWRNSALLGEDFCFTPCKGEVKPLPQSPTVVHPKKTQRKWLEPSLLFQDYLQDGSLGPEMVVIPAGNFKMGDIQNNGDRDEKPVHDVTLKQFAIGRYEVTVSEFQQFVQAKNYKTDAETNGKGCYVRRRGIGWGWREQANWQNSYLEKQEARHPVVCINWHDAVAYVEWLKEQTGQPYALPSEAQWEYMARSDTHSDYWWGNQMGYNKANCWETSRWYQTTSPVGTFPPNSFQVYDTIGNVWEWVADSWHNHYHGAPHNGEVWQEGGNGKYRILRGGSWVSQPSSCRVSERFKVVPTRSTARIGFRVAIKELTL